ncbi:MAG: hypothetical protein ACTHOU_14910 [Aureliella sp.]|jgi:uncharacterized membrane protein
MDSQLIIDVISRIAHVATAIVLVGGSTFMAFVLLPTAQQLDSAQHERLRDAINGRWKRFIHLGILLFLVTGFYNFVRQLPNHKGDSLYHALLGTKILLALGVFFIASALVGRSRAFEGMRAERAKWLKIIVLLAAVIVCISGFVKVRGGKPAVVAPPAAESPS